MRRTGMITCILGLIVTMTGFLSLFRREQTVSNLRNRQAWGYWVSGFGIAHLVLGGMAAVMGRKLD